MRFRIALFVVMALQGGLGVISTTRIKKVQNDQIDAYLSEQVSRRNLPGLAVVITRGDQIVFEKGYGREDGRTPVSPQTQFILASVSKSFTALAVMQLVEIGKIDLDAPVQHYLPEFTLRDPQDAAKITVRQLLNHTSGLADRGFQELSVPQNRAPDDRVKSLRAAQPVAPPGEQFNYFNPNYEILARIVEVTSGQAFSDYLREQVFAPLDMKNSLSVNRSEEAIEKADHLARGHFFLYGVPVAADELRGYIGGSAGVVSSAGDLGHYLIMLNQGGRYQGRQLISASSLDLMRAPPAGVDSTYGMGWFTRQENGRQIVEHNGILSVYSTDLVLIPSEQLGIALLYNGSSTATTAIDDPKIKKDLIALLEGWPVGSGGFTQVHYSLIMGLITLLGTLLAIRSLVRFPTWKKRAENRPAWRQISGILWAFTPAAVLAALPWLVLASSGRIFGYPALFRSLPELFVWLGSTGLLGLVNGALRIGWLTGRTKRPKA